MARLLCFLLTTALLSGCGTLGNGRGWGQDVTLVPQFKRLQQSAIRAVKDPHVWAPAAAAVLVTAVGADQRATAWAGEQTPLFGSQSNALHASDWLRSAAAVGYYTSALATPSGEFFTQAATNKAKGLAMGQLALETNTWITLAVKDATQRERPNGSNRQSFPSAHSSLAFTYANLSRRNLQSVGIGRGNRRWLQGTTMALAAGTAWARVEGQAHHISDVLAGAALGGFLANFFYDGFFGLDTRHPVQVSVEPERKGAKVGIQVPF